MAGELSLKTPLTGLVTLVPTNTATDKTITLPATTGTMVVQDGTNTTTVVNLAYTGTLTGGTGVVNLGSGQVYKDALGQLGIGTASPGYRLDVAAGDTTANFGYAMRLRSNATATAATLQFTNSGVTTENGYIRVTDTGLMSLSNKAYITSAGDVGIGTGSPNQRLQVTGSNGTGFAGATLQNSNGNVGLAGVQFSSDTTYSKSAIAQVRENANGNGPLVFYVDSATDAADWAAGDEKMRISAAGNVGIGTTTTTYKTNIVYTNSAGGVAETGLYLRNTATGNSTQMLFDGHRSYSLLVQGSFGAPAGGFTIQDNTAVVARLSIDSSGNLLVGTTSPATASQSTVVGASLGGTFSWAVIHNAADSAVRGILSRCPNYSGDDGYLFIGNRVTSDVFYIKTNGNVLNLNNSYGALSDIKLKENIIDATPKLNNLNQVRVVSYNLKGENQKQIGVIAQELEQIFPGMVDEMVDRDSEGNSLETTTKAIKYSVFVPMLIKAIQELTARLEVLENK